MIEINRNWTVIYMQILYSNLSPLKTKATKHTFLDRFKEFASKSDRIDIAVGYASKGALIELDSIVQNQGINNIRIALGMYQLEGFPEGIYHTAVKVNAEWMRKGLGEIRLVQPFKYHGKLYAFYHEGKPFAAFIGSHNLGALKLEASNRRQYEISAETTDVDEANEIADFINTLCGSKYTRNIADIKPTDIELIHETNTALSGVELVSTVPIKTVELYVKHHIGHVFRLPLKVPTEADLEYDRTHDDKIAKYTKSNINVCYARPRSIRKSRSWFETQLTVSVAVRRQEGYPEKNHPFFVVTDDGYWFKAHTTSDNNKQFSAVGDELIMGRWLKGRLAAAGLVTPINDTGADIEHRGMITREMLDAYGADNLVFCRTDQKAIDEDGAELSVWTLSFISEKDAIDIESKQNQLTSSYQYDTYNTNNAEMIAERKESDE